MSQPNDGQERIDYRETADITEVHAAIAREHAEPRAGTMPIPMWLGVLSAGALCWAGAYVGMFSGGFNSSIYNEYQSNPAAVFPLPTTGGPDGPVEEIPLLQLGEKTYAKNCVACHGPAGTGGPGNPPIGGSEWVDGSEYNEKRLVAILLKGLVGPITVKGQPYNGAMPAWGTLKPREIAGVATYIRQAFGNKGTGEITEAQVIAAKKEFQDQLAQWKIEQIKAIPLDAKLEGAAPAADAKPISAAPVETKPSAEVKPVVAAPSAPTYDLVASIANGKSVYMQSCMACHQLTGTGVPGAFPPLVATPFVTGDTRRLAAIIIKGIVGPLNVNGTVYVTGMPNPEATFPILKDDKNVADVMNYVRNTWGNKADPIVTPDFVKTVREEFKGKADQWTEADLLNFPAAK